MAVLQSMKPNLTEGGEAVIKIWDKVYSNRVHIWDFLWTKWLHNLFHLSLLR